MESLHLTNEDCKEIIMELKNICEINEDTDFIEEVPVLIGFSNWCDKKNIDFMKISNISFDMENFKLGTAILVHFKEYVKFLNEEEF